DAFAAGVSVAFDDDVGIAEAASQLADFFQGTGNGGVILRVQDRFVRFEGDHHRFGQNLAGAGFGAHLHQGIGFEGGLGEVADIAIFLGHGGENAVGLDLGGGHGGGDRAEGFVDRRSAVPHDFKVGGIERVEKELGVLAIVGQVRVAFGNAAVFAHHVFAVLKGQAEGGGQGLRGAGGVFAHLVHPIEYAADQAGDDFRVVAIEIVAHGPDVGDKMVGRAGGHHEARAFELVGDVVDVRRPA